MSALRLAVAIFLPVLCWRSGFAQNTFGILSHSTVLDPDGKYHLFWDFDDDEIEFEVRVQTLGYVGFGLSPNGGMTGADIVIGGVNADGTSYFEDRHGVGNRQPELDVSDKDYQLISAYQNDTHTVLRFRRKLDTCDKHDIPVTADTMRVIWAYKDIDWASVTTGSQRYHGSQRGAKSVLLLNPQKVPPKLPDDSFTMDFHVDQVKIPGEDTLYYCKAFSLHVFEEPHHIIKVEPIVQPGNEQLVHHVVLYSCPLHTANITAGQGDECFLGFMPEAWRGCDTTIFAWAVGAGPINLPDHVGYPFGFEDDPKLILLQIHYDNPGLRSDWVDSSGLRLTLTRQLRQYDAGSLAIGETTFRTHIIPPGVEAFTTEGFCMADCLAQGMGNESEIHFFAAFPHAHLLGVGIQFRHYRGDEELKPISVDNNYDFNYQETRILPEEVTVRKGDHLSTMCVYNSKNKDSVTFGGESTNEEMCLTFALYYPKIRLGNCNSLMLPQVLAYFAGVTILPNATVIEPESKRGRWLYDVIDKDIDWTDDKIEEFQKLVRSYDNPLINVCLGDAPLPSHGSTVKLAKLTKRYRPKNPCISASVTSSGLVGFVYVIAAMTLLVQ